MCCEHKPQVPNDSNRHRWVLWHPQVKTPGLIWTKPPPGDRKVRQSQSDGMRQPGTQVPGEFKWTGCEVAKRRQVKAWDASPWCEHRSRFRSREATTGGPRIVSSRCDWGFKMARWARIPCVPGYRMPSRCDWGPEVSRPTHVPGTCVPGWRVPSRCN